MNLSRFNFQRTHLYIIREHCLKLRLARPLRMGCNIDEVSAQTCALPSAAVYLQLFPPFFSFLALSLVHYVVCLPFFLFYPFTYPVVITTTLIIGIYHSYYCSEFFVSASSSHLSSKSSYNGNQYHFSMTLRHILADE